MSAPVLRPAREGDLPALEDLYGSLYALLAGFGLPYTLEREGLRAVLEVYLRSSHCFFYVAQTQGQVVGFLSAGITRMDRKLSLRGECRLGVIHDLFLRPAFRGLGLARALADAAEEWMAAQGVRLCQCDVVAGNAPGLSFWQGRGYAPVSTVLCKPLGGEGR